MAIFIGLPFAGLAWIWHDKCDETVVREITFSGVNFLVKEVDCGQSMKIATEVWADPGSEPKTVLLYAGRAELLEFHLAQKTLTMELKEPLDVVKRQIEVGDLKLVVVKPDPEAEGKKIRLEGLPDPLK